MQWIRLAAISLLILFCSCILSTGALAQAQRPPLYVVCYSQFNQPTVYFSGILVGPPTALEAFREGFLQSLMQGHAYQGTVVCAPTNNAVNAQLFMQREQTALTNAKKSVVQTGWTEPPPVPATAPAPAPVPAPASAPVAAAATPVPAASAAGSAPQSNAQGNPEAVSILNTIFGAPAPAASSSSSGSKPAQGQAATNSGAAASGGSATANASPANQVASTLNNIFGRNNSSGGNAGGNAAKPGQPTAGPGGNGAPGQPGTVNASAKGPQNGAAVLPNGALGAAQFSNTKLVVYGCGRQAMQVACVGDLTNEDTNIQNTLLKSADLWKDAFIVDDRGDRHTRTGGFFLNIDGEQRQQLDVSTGKSTRFVMMFDSVPAKVQKITLRSMTGGLDIQDIPIIDTSAPAQPAGQAQPGTSQAQPATPGQAATASLP